MVLSSWSFSSSAGSFLFLPPFSKSSSAPLRNSRFQVLSCWGANSYFWASSASVDRSFNNSKTTLVLNFGVNFLLVVITVNLRINCNLIYCALFWGMLINIISKCIYRFIFKKTKEDLRRNFSTYNASIKKLQNSATTFLEYGKFSTQLYSDFTFVLSNSIVNLFNASIFCSRSPLSVSR